MNLGKLSDDDFSKIMGSSNTNRVDYKEIGEKYIMELREEIR